MLPVTNVPYLVENMLTGQTYTEETSKKKREIYVNRNNTFIVTVTPQFAMSNFFSPSYTYKKIVEVLPNNLDNQILFLNLSKELFRNAKPVEEEFLNILNGTTQKQFSKHPTRL